MSYSSFTRHTPIAQPLSPSPAHIPNSYPCSVIRSKCPTRVGVSGIVAQETYHSFRLIDTQNRLHSACSHSCTLPLFFFAFMLGMICVVIFLLPHPTPPLSALPKEHSVFSLSLGAHRVRLFGDQLVMRAAERTVKKFKHRFTIEL